MYSGCPGAGGLKGTPTLKIKLCPHCGGEIELFSSDSQETCARCGFVAYNDLQSCVLWCAHARDCVGDEAFERFSALRAERGGR